MQTLVELFLDSVNEAVILTPVRRRRISFSLICFLITLFSLHFLRGQQAPPEATPQRPTFTNDTATTAPGTLEFDFGAMGSAGTVTLPTTVKFTPPAEGGFFHQMEFSLGFNSLERVVAGGESQVKFGESLDFVVRRPVWSGNGLSFAVAPELGVFLRENPGVLIGGKAIAVYGFGLNSLVINVSGLGATSPSDSNPGWVSEIAAGYGRALDDSGIASRFSAAFEMLNAFSQSQDAALSLLQALNYGARPGVVLDFAVEQRGLRSGDFEMVLTGGITYNLGYISHK